MKLMEAIEADFILMSVLISDSFGGTSRFDNFHKIVYPVVYKRIMTESDPLQFSKL